MDEITAEDFIRARDEARRQSSSMLAPIQDFSQTEITAEDFIKARDAGAERLDLTTTKTPGILDREARGKEVRSKEGVVIDGQVFPYFPGTSVSKAPPRTAGERFVDDAKNAAREGLGGVIQRAAERAIPNSSTYGAQLRARQAGDPLTDDELYELRAQKVREDDRKRREDYEYLTANDPMVRADRGVFGDALHVGAGLLGSIVGGAATDPTTLINPGGSIGRQLLASGVIGGVADAVSQGIELAEGVKDEYSPAQTAVATAAGPVIGGTIYGAKKLFDVANNLTTPDEEALPRRLFEDDERMVAWEELLKTGDSRAINKFVAQNGLVLDKKDVSRFVKARNAGKDIAPPEPFRPYTKEEVEKETFRLSQGWRNAPEFEFVNTVDEIEDPNIRAQIQKDVDDGLVPYGFYGEDGKVRIIASNIDSPDTLRAAIFHESLGHAALDKKFGAQLNKVLDRFYENSQFFRGKVDAWVRETGSTNRQLASEEVLAEMAEDGSIPATMMDYFKNFIKEVARRAGMRNVEFSEREIRSILATAQREVKTGTGKGVGGLTRFMYIGRGANLSREQRFSQVKAATMVPDRRQATSSEIDKARQKTGWFQGPDGKWRFEIDDSQAVFDRDKLFISGKARLDEILNHPELFQLYPFLRQTEVEVMPFKQGGAADSLKNKISIGALELSSKDPYHRDGVLFHEIQHLIQTKENFAQGGNPLLRTRHLTDFENLITARNTIEDYFTSKKEAGNSAYSSYEKGTIQRLIDDIIHLYEINEKISNSTGLERRRLLIDLEKTHQRVEDVRDLLDDIGQESGDRTNWLGIVDRLSEQIYKNEPLKDTFKDWLDNLYDQNPRLAYDNYLRLAGEVEARDTQRRIELDKDWRKIAPPELLPRESEKDVTILDQDFFGYVSSPDVLTIQDYWKNEAHTDLTPEDYEAILAPSPWEEAQRLLSRSLDPQSSMELPDNASIRIAKRAIKRDIDPAFNKTLDDATVERGKALIRVLEKVEKTASDIFSRAEKKPPITRYMARRPKEQGGLSDKEIEDVIKAWHGTPALFKNTSEKHPLGKFDHSFMGKGEGNQAFGWGTYLSTLREIAEDYRRQLTKRGKVQIPFKDLQLRVENLLKPGEAEVIRNAEYFEYSLAKTLLDGEFYPFSDTTLRETILDTLKARKSFYSWRQEDLKVDPENEINQRRVAYDDLERKVLEGVLKSLPDNKGSLYEVELPASAVFLDLDEKLSGQPEVVQRRLVDWITGPDNPLGAKRLLPDYRIDDNTGLFKPVNLVKELTGKDFYKELRGNYGSQEKASKSLLERGIEGNRYLIGVDRKKGQGRHNFVIFDDDLPRIVGRYMRKKPERINGLNIDSFNSSKETQKLLRGMARDQETYSIPHQDTLAEAKLVDVSPENFLKLRAGIDQVDLLGGKILISRLAPVAVALGKKIDAGNATDVEMADFVEKMTMLASVVNHFTELTSQTARNLNILKAKIGGIKSGNYTIRYMMESGGFGGAMTSEASIKAMARMISQAQNTAQVAQVAKDATKPHFEDYITSLRYSMMLSGLGTQAKAFLGTVSNIALNAADLTVAAGIGLGRRALGDPRADTVTMTELGYRTYGLLRALWDWNTYHNAAKSYALGEAVNAPERLDLTTTATLPGSIVTEYPRRGLAAIDSFFRSFIEQSEMYGLAVRQALKEGKKGQDFADRVNDLAVNPTDEMRRLALREADLQQLLSNDSPLVKMLNVGKARTPGMDGRARIMRFAIQNVLPFVRNMDNIANQLVRHTPVLNLLVGNVRDDLKAGGALADIVVARLLVGSTVMTFAAHLAMNGLLTGDRSEDFERAEQDLSGGIPPRSFKTPDGQWRSYDGLDALALPFSLVASIYERNKRGELDDKNAAEVAATVLQMAASLSSEATFLSDLNEFTGLFSGDGDANYIAGVAGSFAPAIMRQYTQNVSDPAVRVTTGDGSWQDKIEGRLKAATPGLSKTLPQKVDVYGRPMERVIEALPSATTFGRTVRKEDNPIVLEVNRLSETISEPLVKPIYNRREGKRIPAEEYVELQQLAGEIVLENLEKLMSSKSWKEMSDVDKRVAIKSVVGISHDAARKAFYDEITAEEFKKARVQ